MSLCLWKALPDGFLKRGYRSFDRLEQAVKQLVIDLAKEQNFRCALCSQDRDLVVEHDHEPGEKVVVTVFNVRGLVCQRCNQALKGCDMAERGYFTSWENGYPYLSEWDYEDYKYRFENRVEPLIDAAHVQRVGCRNIERRKHVLWVLDRRYEEGRFPWQLRSKKEWNGEIKSPDHALQVLAACMQFVVEQHKADPDYKPPEKFLRLMSIVGPMVEQAMADRSPMTMQGSNAILPP